MDVVGIEQGLNQAKEWSQRMAALLESHQQLKAEKEIKEEDPELSPSTEAAIIKPNLNSIRKILGGDGTDQQRKVVEENTGLIPKYYKPYKLLESTEHGRPVSLYRCDFCNQDYRGHNSIVYHCRRHIGDYPYRCEDCGFVEVCKSGLSSHMNRTGHVNCRKIDAHPMNNGSGTVAQQNITQIRKNKHPLSLPVRSPSPAEKRKRLEDKEAPPKKSANIAAFDALSQLNNNDFKGLDFWKSKVDMGKMAENSWFLMGGRGVKTPTKRTSPRKSPRKPVVTPPSPETDTSSDVEEVVTRKTSKPDEKSTNEKENWKFCTKCRSAWLNLEPLCNCL